MKFKEKISIYYTSLTPTEKKICTKILDNPEIIIKNSIIDAGNKCDTSKSAMLRFAKKLGYSGYSEFKYAISEDYDSKPIDETTDVNESFLKRISSLFAESVYHLGNLNYELQLQQLAKMIDEYPYVKSIGIGNTSFCANQLVYSLYSYNKFIECVGDCIQFDYLKNCLNSEYLLIIFSVTCSETKYLDLVKTAKNKGAKIIVITMNNEHKLITLSDLSFILPSQTSPLQNKKVLKQLDNRTMMYFFAEIISYYYGLHLEKK